MNKSLAFSFLFCALFYTFLCAGQSAAQPPPEALARQDSILQQNQERQREFLEERQAPVPPHSLNAAPLPFESGEEGAPVIFVHTLDIQGDTLLPARFLRRLTREYEGRSLSLADINNITRIIVNKYSSMGYISSRALVEAQDLRSGVLRIVVVEGVLEDIIPEPHSGIDPRQISAAFPGLRGKPLNLRDIEQGLDQINRLPSRNVTMRIEPGETYGGSKVFISDSPEKSWRASVELDNGGQRATGEYIQTLSLDKDNFVGCFDQAALSYSFDSPHYAREINRDSRGYNRAFNAYVSVPYGYWLAFASLNVSQYEHEVEGLSSSYRMSGDTESLRLGLERVVHRDAKGKTGLGLTAGSARVRNFFEGFPLDASSYRLGTISAYLSHTRRVAGGVLSLRAETTLGGPWFGAQDDSQTDHASPRREFHKFVLSLQWFRPFSIAGQRFLWDSSFNAQWANHTLYGMERYSLGSRHSVRGFTGSPLDGDQGMTARNDLAWILPLSLTGQDRVTDVHLYAACDWGKVLRDAEDPYEHGSLRGLAFGLRTQGRLTVDCSWAWPLSAPAHVRRTPGIFMAAFRYAF